MTQQDDITQRVLTDDEINTAIDWPAANTTMRAENDRAMAREVEAAVLRKLSKLRAPVADERAALQKLVDLEDMRLRLRALHENGHGTDYDHYHKALPAAWEAARAALASARVAGEARPVACLRRQIDGSDWGHWKPGSVEDGQRVTGLRSWQVRWLVDAAPQASAEAPKLPRGWQLALNLAIDAIENAAPMDWPVNWPAILHGLKELRDALSQPQADKDGGGDA